MTDKLREALERLRPIPERLIRGVPVRDLDEILVAADAALAAAPQPAVTDRDALVEVLAAELGDSYDCTRVWSAWSVGTMGEDDFRPVNDRVDDIADALLARGLRLPGGGETVAWAVVGPNGISEAFAVYPGLKEQPDMPPCSDSRIVRVAIRVVEGGDDEA